MLPLRRPYRRTLYAGSLLLALPLVGFGLWSGLQPDGGGRDSQRSIHQSEWVVLVHGLGRTSLSMLPLQYSLEAEGYRVYNWGYSSLCCSVEELAENLVADLHQAGIASEAERIHFVGHSLGNIIIKSALKEPGLTGSGRVVMLAPPNQGSHAADRYLRFVGWLFPPLAELTTAPTSTARKVTIPASVEVGVIAGAEDGKVDVSETHLSGQRAHAVVPSAHTFIMLRQDVQRLVTRFLEDGTFAG